MIILGTRGVTSRRGAGMFFCPQCRGQREYEHKAVRRFFTLYFIPVIPLDLIGEYVECHTCRGAFDSSVLTIDVQAIESAVQQEFFEHVKRILVLFMIADGAADEQEMRAVQEFLPSIGASRPDTGELARQVQLARDAQATAAAYARGIAEELSEEGKRLIVQGAFLVATAGGQLGPEHQAQLQQLPGALRMSEQAFREAVRRASEEV